MAQDSLAADPDRAPAELRDPFNAQIGLLNAQIGLLTADYCLSVVTARYGGDFKGVGTSSTTSYSLSPRGKSAIFF